MPIRSSWTCGLLFVVASGCASSLHPLASSHVTTATPDLMGVWQVTGPRDFPGLKAGAVCTMKHFGKGMYNLQIDTVDGKSTDWEASVVKLGDALYLDVQPGLGELKGRPEAPLVAKLHGIFLLQVEGDEVRLISFHQNKLYETAKQAGISTTADANSKMHLFTADTPALQEFFEKHGAELALRDSKPVVLKRMATKATP